MTNPGQANQDTAEALKNRLQKIKQNPEQALFSEFRGTSRSGAITTWVDLMGRYKRIHIEPGTLREGDEQWLTEEINSALVAARKSADFLDFDVAQFAAELEQTPALRSRVVQEDQDRPGPPKRERPPDDDDFFDGFGIRK